MKRFAVIIFILFLGSIANETVAQKKGRAVVCFQSDMDCVNCEKSVYEQLRFEKGVKDLKVDHISNTIMIEFVETKNDDKGFARAIEAKGYKAEKIDRETYDRKIAQAKKEVHKHNNEVHKEHN